MKRSDYFYAFLLLGILALIIYGFLNYVWFMVGLIAFSSVFSFTVFLIQTKIKTPKAENNSVEEPIDFYKEDIRTTYYLTDLRKQVNAE